MFKPKFFVSELKIKDDGELIKLIIQTLVKPMTWHIYYN